MTSSLRIGTPAITTRGLRDAASRELAGWISDVLDHNNDESLRRRVREQETAICNRFPVYEALQG